jgi:hypothetical protein
MLVVLNLGLKAGFEPDHGGLDEENLWIALIKDSLLMVPLAALNEHTIDIDAIFRWWWVLFLNDLEVED